MGEKVEAARTGEFLAALRKAKGMTQEQVAESLCVSNKTISKWESGSGLPDITILPDLAEFYGVTADDILAGQRLQGREMSADIREQHWRRLYRRAEMRMMVLGCCMVSLSPVGMMIATETGGYGSRLLGRYLQTNEVLVLLCTLIAVVVLWYTQRSLGESLEGAEIGASGRITVLGHRLLLLVPLVSLLCLRSEWALHVEDWRRAPADWGNVTLYHLAYLTVIVTCGLLLLLLHSACKRAGGRLLGPVGGWVFGFAYTGSLVCAVSSFGVCLCRDLLYSDIMIQSYKKQRQMIAIISQIGGSGAEALLLVFVMGFALYTILRLEEDPRK